MLLLLPPHTKHREDAFYRDSLGFGAGCFRLQSTRTSLHQPEALAEMFAGWSEPEQPR